MEKKIIFQLNVHYNGLIVIMKILFVLPANIIQRDGGTHLAGLEELQLDQLLIT